VDSIEVFFRVIVPLSLCFIVLSLVSTGDYLELADDLTDLLDYLVSVIFKEFLCGTDEFLTTAEAFLVVADPFDLKSILDPF